MRVVTSDGRGNGAALSLPATEPGASIPGRGPLRLWRADPAGEGGMTHGGGGYRHSLAPCTRDQCHSFPARTGNNGGFSNA